MNYNLKGHQGHIRPLLCHNYSSTVVYGFRKSENFPFFKDFIGKEIALKYIP